MRIVLALLLAGCSGSPPAPQSMQRTTADGTCEEIAWSCVALKQGTEDAWGCIEGNSAQTAQYQSSCTPEKDGRFALNACMRDNIAGGCTLARGSQCTTTWFHTPASRAEIEAECLKQKARFVAP